MASWSHLNKLEHSVLDEGMAESIEEMLPSGTEGDLAREALMHARRDVVGKTDALFKANILVGCLARVVAEQNRRIAELEDALPQKKAKVPATK